MSDQTPDHLPPIARDIAEVIGLDGLDRLVNAYGGTEIRVPGRGDLREVLTNEQFDAFTSHFKGEKIAIPRLAGRLAALRAAETRRLASIGMTRAAIARVQGLCERTIYKHLAEPDDQLDLFDPQQKERK